MNPLDALESIREAQASANLSGRRYSVCNHNGELVVMLKVQAVELGYEIIETCNPVLVKQ